MLSTSPFDKKGSVCVCVCVREREREREIGSRSRIVGQKKKKTNIG